MCQPYTCVYENAYLVYVCNMCTDMWGTVLVSLFKDSDEGEAISSLYFLTRQRKMHHHQGGESYSKWHNTP